MHSHKHPLVHELVCLVTLVLLSSQPLLLLLSVVATDKLTELLDPCCNPLAASNDMSSSDVLSSRSLHVHRVTNIDQQSFIVNNKYFFILFRCVYTIILSIFLICSTVRQS